MFHGKCAFCETCFTHAAHGHIEHFWPKATYPERTFEWENLLWACPICNSDHKGDRFPLDSGSPILLDPTVDLPRDHLSFVWDNAAKLATVVGTTDRGRTTVETIALNRDDLRFDRSKAVKTIAALIALLPDRQAAALLTEARLDSAEYAAFARVLLETSP